MNDLKEKIEQLKEITGASERTGWIRDNVAFYLWGLVKFYDPDLVLNIGHLWGKSSMIFCDAMFGSHSLEETYSVGDTAFKNFVEKDAISYDTKKVISVDPHLHAAGHRQLNCEGGVEFLESAYENFQFYKQKSQDFLATTDLSSYKRKFAFIDGDHTYQGALQDVRLCCHHNFDFIIVDDTAYLPNVRQAALDGFSAEYQVLEHTLWNGFILGAKR